VPFAPGGGTDVIAAHACPGNDKDLGRIDHYRDKPGRDHHRDPGCGNHEPDGYTLLMGTFANAVNPSLNPKLPYDQHRDFAAVALVARSSISSWSIRNHRLNRSRI